MRRNRIAYRVDRTQQDNMLYDTLVIPLSLQSYFDSKIEPLRRPNMIAGCSQRTNNARVSVNHVMKQ